MSAPAIDRLIEHNAVAHLDFESEHPCEVATFSSGECGQPATWWQRKLCCGAVSFNCGPHRAEVTPSTFRVCRSCLTRYNPATSDWGRL